MNQYTNWDDHITLSTKSAPLPNEDFDQYFAEYNEIDDLFNETLTGLQDLDVPSGFVNHDIKQNNFLLPHATTVPSNNNGHTAPNTPNKKQHSRQQSGTAIFGFPDHNRELSISGLTNDLYKSVRPSVDLSRSVMPGELLKTLTNSNNSENHPSNDELDFNFLSNPIEISKPIYMKEEDEFEAPHDQELSQQQQQQQQKLGSPIKQKEPAEDFIVTNENPKSYKFPSSPISSSQNHHHHNTSKQNPHLSQHQQNDINGSHTGNRSINNFSVKYLKELHRFQNYTNSSPLRQEQPVCYVDDIEPLLKSYPDSSQTSNFQNKNNIQSSKDTQAAMRTPKASAPTGSESPYKFVPIPVQQPLNYQRKQDNIDSNNTFMHQNVGLKNNANLYLPPPSPPTLSNGSPEWSSPEPQSPSPSRITLNQGFYSNQNSAVRPNNHFMSPIGPQSINSQQRHNKNFYNPQFFSEANNNNNNSQSNFTPNDDSNIAYQLQSSPVSQQSLNSSPIRYYSSPIRNNQLTNDDTIDANATITQITPLKNQLPNTPNRNRVQLEWSPIISPNAKYSLDVKAAIQQSSPRRKIKKTSLLPPGELDQYWVGPDEEKAFTCTYKNCGKKFTRRYNVRSHIQTHLSDRPFGCSYCPKKFVRQHDLNRHVKGHLEARHCQCPCGKEFARLDAMRKHRARNICSGGVANTENNCITKPNKVRRGVGNHEVLDEITSDKLTDDLSSSLDDEVLRSIE